MKRLYVVLVVMVVLGLVVAGGGRLLVAQESQTNVQPTVSVWPAVAKLHSSTSVVILGAGFEPGQELYVLLQPAGMSPSNIQDSLNPGIVTDEGGGFATLFTIDGYDKVSAEGVYSIIVTDTNYQTLAITALGLADPDGRSQLGIYPEGKPDYAKNPKDPRPLPWCAPFFEYPKRPK